MKLHLYSINYSFTPTPIKPMRLFDIYNLQQRTTTTKIMASFRVQNENDFMTSLTLPSFHKKTKHFLKFYLTQDFKFMAHQDYQLNMLWLKSLDEAKSIEDIESLCDDMYDRLFNTGEYRIIFDEFFNTGLRSLFGGMYGMNRDFWLELGIDDDEAYHIFHFEKLHSFQKFQVIMCWELFWGMYGENATQRMANYTHMKDDLFTTISMSKLTPYYMGALNLCLEETPQWFVYTVVNIFMHAFTYIKYTRKQKYFKEDITINNPLWLVYRNKQLTQDANYFKKPLCETMKVHYDEKHMEENCLPACVKEML